MSGNNIKIEITLSHSEVMRHGLGTLLSDVGIDDEGNVYRNYDYSDRSLIGTYKIETEEITRVVVQNPRSCPCMPENGGSGICGCVLGGPKITS